MSRALAADKTVLFIVEDLHWVDPKLTLLLDQVPTARLLALLTARPSFIAPWPARSHLTSLTLTPFTSKQTETMASRVWGQSPPAEVLRQIVSKTDGVPLFVEELTKMVLESGLLAEQEEPLRTDGPAAAAGHSFDAPGLADGAAPRSGAHSRSS